MINKVHICDVNGRLQFLFYTKSLHLMKNKNSSINVIKLLGNLVKIQEAPKKYIRPKVHQPSWMYRNE